MDNDKENETENLNKESDNKCISIINNKHKARKIFLKNIKNIFM